MISLLRKGEALPGHQEEAADEIERLRDWNDHLNNTVLPNILNPNFLMLMKGGERLLDLCTKDGKFIGVSLNDMKDVFDWMVTHARIAPDQAALAQPSPAQGDEKPGDSILCYGCFAKGVGPDHFDEAGKCLAAQGEQAEPKSGLEGWRDAIRQLAEQEEAVGCQGTNCGTTTGDHSPECLAEAAASQGWELKPEDLGEVEVVGYLATAEHPKHGQPHKAFNYFKDQHDAQVAHWRERGCTVTEDRLMTVSQHERIVGALRAENTKLSEALDESDGDRWKLRSERDAANARLHEVATDCATAEQERDAALARVAELERVLRVVVNAADHGSWPTTVMHGIEKVREVLAGSAPPVKAQPEETPGEILAAKLIETWVAKHGKPAPWSKIVEITALATNMPNDERDRLLALDDDVDAQAQHSVPGNAAALVRAEGKKYSLNAAGMLDSGAPEHAQTFAIVQLLSEFDDEEAESHWEAIMAYSDFRTSDALFHAAELLAAAPGKEVGHE
ncbi:hypothetical protein CSB93_4830 [Pseudomonas paraeruginosa]|uniref:Uncharacterized protein n=1 Tax=Pseudomonas paraeruginosa TaxID=2994495 RepID=A0A2R3IZP4_9PSED|nr:hypothetical protein CSB93_4830 [Pseudomonas paraeruginosa]AWE95387.1 hypothetical protein CSC28_3620 [Pseudomonas paraeruginosa]